MPLLTPEIIVKIGDEAIRLGLTNSRSVLLASIDNSYVATLETSEVPADQLRLDLAGLNRTVTLVGGALPLKQWLKMAATQTHALPEGQFFRECADQVHEQPPPTPEEVAARARLAMDGLRGLAAADPGAAQALKDAREELEALTRGLKPIGVHKRLHDLLHTYQIEKLPTISDALAGPWTDDDFRRQILIDMVGSFERTLQDGRVALEKLKPESRDRKQPEDWLRLLAAPHLRLTAAIAGSATVPAGDAFREFRNEISKRMSLLNVLMWNRADDLGIEALVERLRGIVAAYLPLDDDRAIKLRATATQLATLGLEVRGLLSEHYRWQAFEDELWSAEDDIVYKGETDYALSTFSERWPAMVVQVSELAGTPPAPWLIATQQYVAAFAELCPLPATRPISGAARLQFRGFVKSARQQFYQVDSALDARCNRLSVITDPIEELARTL